MEKEKNETRIDLDAIERTALAAAFEAGNILAGRFGKKHDVSKKGGIDLVTEADVMAEKAVVRIIGEAFPDHAVLAEEEGELGAKSPCQWIIDPLDGTTNFAHHIPIFAVSIAFALNGETLCGVVLNPVSGELFTARKEKGAYYNGKKIRVTERTELMDSLLVTGFPYDLATRVEGLMTRFSRVLTACQGVRRLGSAALDLCWVALGRFDGFWEENLKPWDTAAGALIVAEAGGRVTDFGQGPWTPFKKEVLATNGSIHEALSGIITS